VVASWYASSMKRYSWSFLLEKTSVVLGPIHKCGTSADKIEARCRSLKEVGECLSDPGSPIGEHVLLYLCLLLLHEPPLLTLAANHLRFVACDRQYLPIGSSISAYSWALHVLSAWALLHGLLVTVRFQRGAMSMALEVASPPEKVSQTRSP
jgi:hypothetical protein